jgi:hypothetical protein
MIRHAHRFLHILTTMEELHNLVNSLYEAWADEEYEVVEEIVEEITEILKSIEND